MKVAIAQADFARGIQLVQRAVSHRPSTPGSGGVLLEAADGRLWFKATDYELAITCSCQAAVDRAGSIVLPVRYLADVIRKLPSGEVSIDVPSERPVAEFAWQRSRFSLHGSTPEQFPQLPACRSEAAFHLSQDELKDLIRGVAFAVSDNEDRAVLTGALLAIDGKTVEMVGTDGARLAYASCQAQRAAEGKVQAVIPGRAFLELTRALNYEGEATVRVVLEANQVFFQVADLSFMSRLIEGEFPKFRSVIPTDFPSALTVDGGALLAACERAAVFAAEKASAVQLNAAQGLLTIHTEAADVGRVREELPCEFAGEPITAAFNVRFLIEGLRTLGQGPVTLEFGGQLKPCRITRMGDSSAYYIVLPMRVQ